MVFFVVSLSIKELFKSCGRFLIPLNFKISLMIKPEKSNMMTQLFFELFGFLMGVRVIVKHLQEAIIVNVVTAVSDYVY